MRNYRNNAKLLVYLAPFRALSISAAYLVPFFLEKGLSQSDIFVLQSIFSLSAVLLEVPSGWFADCFGRAFSIKLSVPVAAFSMIAYSQSNEYWQFVLFEVLLAVASTLVSGADKALLMDSLKASSQEDQYVRTSQRMHYFGFGAVVASFPFSLLIIQYVGVSATLLADGLITLAALSFIWRLVESPIHEAEELSGHTAWSATKQLMGHKESRWLIALSVLLSVSTYFGAWVAAPYYESIGIPLIWFGAIYAGRALIKTVLGRFVSIDHRLQRSMKLFVLLGSMPYIAMASGIPWLAFAVFGHDIVHTLQQSSLEHRYNRYIASSYRAMLNSVVGMQTRLLMAALGPLVGLAIDTLGFQRGLVLVGTCFGVVLAFVYWRVARLNAFDERR